METNQNSNNLYAEALLRMLSAQALPSLMEGRYTSPTDSTEMGLRVVRAILTKLSGPRCYVLADGSGYLVIIWSVQKRSCKLWGQWCHQRHVYIEPLPVAGISGTLRNRCTHAQGIIEAKKVALWAAWSRWLDMLTPSDYQPLVSALSINLISLLSLSGKRSMRLCCC